MVHLSFDGAVNVIAGNVVIYKSNFKIQCSYQIMREDRGWGREYHRGRIDPRPRAKPVTALLS